MLSAVKNTILLLKLAASFSSNSRQETNLLSLIQPLFESSADEPNISGDSSIETCPVCRLYILGPPASARFFAQNVDFPCTYYTTERPLDVDFPLFLVFAGDTKINVHTGSLQRSSLTLSRASCVI